MSGAVLAVSCPDRKGLVAALATLLSDHGGNILEAQQHVDRIEKRFFQRIHFDVGELDISHVELRELLRIECGRYQMDWRLSYDDEPKRVAIFVSKIEHCLWDLLIRHRLRELPCEIALVISNHPDLAPVAEEFGVPFHVVTITKETKRAQEDAASKLLEDHNVDLIVLARYMQILTDEFVSRYPQGIINIHHSFLPAFIGAKPYHQAYERGVKNIGATAHYATSELDEGPILAQDVVECSHQDTVGDLVRKGRDVERMVLARGVRAHLEDRVLVCGRRTVIF